MKGPNGAGSPSRPRGDRVTSIVLRFMRRPILVLIAAYSLAMAGWVLIPGIDNAGNPTHLSFFHAFYFLTYTATTTGFGELPYPFTDAQRMWGIICLYGTVVAWLYAVGTIIGLLQNPNFQQAMAARRFAKVVDRMTEPFYIICGFGDTGSLLARGLSDSQVAAVVIDGDPERIKALMLRDYQVPMPGLCADARVPTHLIDAGVLKPNCKGVVALTRDEEVNLKISVSARLLNPQASVVTWSTSPDYEETLASLGGDTHIVDPFQTFARYLGATLDDPMIHTLSQWISGSPGVTLETVLRPPSGTWILCGYGRMGRQIHEALKSLGIAVAAIDPDPVEALDGVSEMIVGRATRDNLRRAGVEQAAGMVIGTASDSENLSILVNAKALNPDIFLIVRQNRHRNEVVFQAGRADFIMQPDLVTARRILFLLVAPLLKTFFEALRDNDPETESPLLARVVKEMHRVVGGTRPRIWTLEVDARSAPAFLALRDEHPRIALGDLLRDPIDRGRRLACIAMVVEADGFPRVMPGPATTVAPGCQILFCGTNQAYRMLEATLHNEYTLRYLITGTELPRSAALRWLAARRQGQLQPG